MTTDWDPGPPEAMGYPEDDARRALREALIRFGIYSHDLSEELRPFDPRPGSLAADALADEPQWVVPGVNPAPVREALQNIHLAITSGHDHVWTLGLALGMPRELGTSFSTVIRGALEAYARAYYLMGDRSVRDIMVRHLASRRSTLDQGATLRRDSDGEKRTTPLRDWSLEYQEQVRTLADAWGMTWEEIKPTTYRASVEDVLAAHEFNSGIPIPDGLYGALSDTAHAETVGFRSFVRTRDVWNEHGQQAYTPGLNYRLLNAHVSILTGVCADVTRWYLEFCGATDKDAALWIEALGRLLETALAVDAEFQKIGAEEASRRPR
jgi:hypothetical protein